MDGKGLEFRRVLSLLVILEAAPELSNEAAERLRPVDGLFGCEYTIALVVDSIDHRFGECAMAARGSRVATTRPERRPT